MLRSANSWQNIRSDSQLWQCSTVSSVLLLLLLILIPSQATAETPHFPVEIAGMKVTRVVDLTLGYDTGNPPTHKPSLPLSLGHMIQFRAESSGGGTKIVLTIRYVCSLPMSVIMLYYCSTWLSERVALSRKYGFSLISRLIWHWYYRSNITLKAVGQTQQKWASFFLRSSRHCGTPGWKPRRTILECLRSHFSVAYMKNV